MFEIELTDVTNTKEIMYYITMCTKDVKFKLKRNNKRVCYTLKVFTKTHVLDVIKELESRVTITKAHKITFKIDGNKHFTYIGMPY